MTIAAPVAAEFPVLASGAVTYLDSAATSQTPRSVIDAMTGYYTDYRASVHRGVYEIAARATEGYEGARVKAARLAGSSPGETILTRNATEAINLVAYSWGMTNVGEGDLIVLTDMEHHSNLVPWQLLAERTGATIGWVGIDDDGRLKLDELDALLAREPKLVAVTHASNVLGTVNPIADVCARAHAAGAIVVVDGSQAVPHMPVDVSELGADFYAWTAHKAYGPTGIGILHGRRALLEAMPPFISGGHMISRVTKEGSKWADPPAKFEAGTSPIAEAIGLGAAVDFIDGIGTGALWEHNREIAAYAIERLSEVPGLTIHGPRDERVALVSFALDGIHPHDVAEILGRDQICVRAGHHCAQVLMKRLQVSATTRASFAVHSTREDVDKLVDGLATVQRIFA